jgi:hypothetical protein
MSYNFDKNKAQEDLASYFDKSAALVREYSQQYVLFSMKLSAFTLDTELSTPMRNLRLFMGDHHLRHAPLYL